MEVLIYGQCLRSIGPPYCAYTCLNRTPYPCDPIHSLCYFSGQKRGSQGRGCISEWKKGLLLLVPTEWGLSHLERPVYSPSIMALIFWSLLSNSIHPHTHRLTPRSRHSQRGRTARGLMPRSHGSWKLDPLWFGWIIARSNCSICRHLAAWNKGPCGRL